MNNFPLFSAITMAGLGGVFALILAVAYQWLKVDQDPRLTELEEALPGLNCGACGFASCHMFAETLLKGTTLANGCRPGGEDTAEALAKILGVEAPVYVKRVALARCGANGQKRKKKGDYIGVQTCEGAQMVGGDILCGYGCLGYGDCFRACLFGAIVMKDQLPVIIPSKCTSCGACVTACPRKLFTIEPFDPIDGVVAVLCSSRAPAKETKAACPVGCIGCGICAKLTQNTVFSIIDNLAKVDYNQATDQTNWESPRVKCPTSCIVQVCEADRKLIYRRKNAEEVMHG